MAMTRARGETRGSGRPGEWAASGALSENYFTDHTVLRPSTGAEGRDIIETRELALLCARACEEKKGTDIKLLDVRKALPILDYFVIVTGKNRRHLRSMADAIRVLLRANGHEVPREEAGEGGGKWLLLDFGDGIVHLFDEETREYYDLDGLWADSPQVPLESGEQSCSG